LYQPTHFTIGNYLGTKEEFEALTKAAVEYGIYIIVDAIPNHTTAYWQHIDPFLRDHEPSLFHSRRGDTPSENPWIRQMDFGDRRSFVRSNLLGLWDLYTSRPELQALYMEFLDEIITAGASGFRFDAAHHIEMPNDPPDIASNYWPNISAFVDNRVRELGRIPFQYGEILGAGYRANHYLHGLYEHANFMVTPYAYSRHILSAVDLGFLTDGQYGWNSHHFHIYGNPRDQGDTVFGAAFRAADLGGHVGFAEGVVPWVESHDQYGNEGMSRHLTDEQIITGWALIAARQGTSPLFFVRPGEGFVNSGTMFVPLADGSFANAWGHQLLYRDPAVAAINWFANDFIAYPEVTSTHGNVALIQRGTIGAMTGAVIVNVGNDAAEVLFPVQMADGLYTCRISTGEYTVLGGWLNGPAVSAQSVLVLRDPAPISAANAQPVLGVFIAGDSRLYEAEGKELFLIAQNSLRQYVSVERTRGNETSVLLESTPFNHNQLITVGAGAEIGDKFMITLTASDADGNITRTFTQTLTKVEPPSANLIRVEYVRNVNPWTQAGIWAWTARGDVFTEGWPGPEMEWLPRSDGEGYAWVFYLPENTVVPVTLIFNNFGAGEQTVPYLTITENTRVFQIGNGLEIGNAEVIER
jgi:alpha-amylase